MRERGRTQHGRDNHSLNSTSENWVGDDGECLVDDHVGHQECNQKQVTILANRDNLLGLSALFWGSSAREYLKRSHIQREVSERQSGEHTR